MGLLEGWTSGTQLGLAAQEAKLKAALWKSQSDHLDVQTQLAQHEMQKQQTMQGLMQQAQMGGQLRDFMTANPEQAQAPSYETEPGMVGPPRLQSAITAPAMAGMVNLKAALDTIPPKPLDMMTLAGLAGNSRLFKESAQLQQGALEHQKVQLQLRTEGLQNQAAQLIQEIQTIPANDPQQAGKLMLKQLQLAGLMTQMGKTGDALKLLQPDTKAVDVTQRLVQTPGMVGQQPQVILPATKTKAEQEAEMENARQFVRSNPPGTPYPASGAPQAAPETPQAPPPAPETPTTPGPLTAKQEGEKQQLMERYQISEAFATELVLKKKPKGKGGASATPPAPGESYTEIQERQRQQTLQNVQAGTPNATAGDVETVKKRAERRATQIPREAAEAIGVPLTTTYGDIEDGKVKPESGSTVPRQLPTGKEREDLGDYEKVITLSQGLVEQLQKNPKAAELLGNWLNDPAAAWKRLRARQGAAASPEGRAFLAEYGIASAQLRTTLIGLAQTNQEMGSLLDAIPKPDAGAENIIAGLQSVIKTTKVQRDAKLKVQQGLGVKTPTGSPAPGAPGAAAQPQGKSAVEKALRDQGLIK